MKQLLCLAIEFAMLAFVVFSLAQGFYSKGKELNLMRFAVWKRFRIKMFFEVLGVLFLTISVYILMWGYIPLLRFGWFNLCAEGGGNAFAAPVIAALQSTHILIRILPSFLLVALLFAMSLLVYYEEKVFRGGYHEWRDIIRQSVKFGLFHLIFGIPLAAAIALMGVGFFYGSKYKNALCSTMDAAAEDEAVMESTAYHTMYNMILVTILLVTSLKAAWA